MRVIAFDVVKKKQSYLTIQTYVNDQGGDTRFLGCFQLQLYLFSQIPSWQQPHDVYPSISDVPISDSGGAEKKSPGCNFGVPEPIVLCGYTYSNIMQVIIPVIVF